jgi:hypothetical protein
MSLMGPSILISEGLVCDSGGERECGGGSRSVGGGVGSCAGALNAWSTSVASSVCCSMAGECEV